MRREGRGREMSEGKGRNEKGGEREQAGRSQSKMELGEVTK